MARPPMPVARDSLIFAPLVGRHVRIDPLSEGDAEALFAAAGSAATFRWFSAPPTPWSVEGMRAYCTRLLAMPDLLALTVRDRRTGEVVGATTYCDIRPAHRGLEIGWTFVAPDRRGTAVNPETKLLLLAHAFETPLFAPPVPGHPDAGPAVRVMLKTHHLNHHSQRAIAKLGAVHEGVLRNHIVMPDGSLRHTVVYSVTPVEWPDVAAGLRARLAALDSGDVATPPAGTP